MADKFSAGGLRDSLRDAGTAVAHAVRFLDIAAAEQAELRARITALQAQLAEARGKAIEECIAAIRESARRCARLDNPDAGALGAVEYLLTKPAGEGA